MLGSTAISCLNNCYYDGGWSWVVDIDRKLIICTHMPVANPRSVNSDRGHALVAEEVKKALLMAAANDVKRQDHPKVIFKLQI
jgi:hypothetical protein